MTAKNRIVEIMQGLPDDVTEEIRTKIAQSSEQSATRFVVRMFTGAERLEEFPELGRIAPRFNRRNARELILGNYNRFTGL